MRGRFSTLLLHPPPPPPPPPPLSPPPPRGGRGEGGGCESFGPWRRLSRHRDDDAEQKDFVARRLNFHPCEIEDAWLEQPRVSICQNIKYRCRKLPGRNRGEILCSSIEASLFLFSNVLSYSCRSDRFSDGRMGLKLKFVIGTGLLEKSVTPTLLYQYTSILTNCIQ